MYVVVEEEQAALIVQQQRNSRNSLLCLKKLKLLGNVDLCFLKEEGQINKAFTAKSFLSKQKVFTPKSFLSNAT
jgi:hypothetical protein